MTKKLWGGRFQKKTDPIVEEFTKSIHFDKKLAECDLLGSMLHVEILRRAGYLNTQEARKLYSGLAGLHKSLKDGKFKFDPDSEDIHTDIQNKLESKIGKVALKLHTARSRNDQVAFATKLYSKLKILELQITLANLVLGIDNLAQKYRGVIMPGFTHMQHAQPVYLRDYLGAYTEMFKRDNKRLNNTFKNIALTMGAGALAGTPVKAANYDIRASKYMKGLDPSVKEFDVHVTANSLDAVSDRDFVIEILSALAVIGMHLSRFSEDMIIWSTKEFGFAEIDDAFCTGSSLMPQKKNPDSLELTRGSAGRLYGNLVSVLTVMKALPLAYNRDMQLDKEPLFDSCDTALSELKAMAGLVKTLKFNEAKITASLGDESLYATDIVYYLVDKGLAFKEAHSIVGRLVRSSLDSGMPIKSMPESELKKFSAKLVKSEVIKLFDPKFSVESKKSIKR